MSEPLFTLPQDTGNSRISKSQISLIRIESDPRLKNVMYYGWFRGFTEFQGLKHTGNALDYLEHAPVKRAVTTPASSTSGSHAATRSYEFAFNGSGLPNGHYVWIAACNYSSKPDEICSFKTLHVNNAGQVLVATPLRAVQLAYINIVKMERWSTDDNFIYCEGSTSAPLADAVLIEHDDWIDIFYTPIVDDTGPNTWICRFNVGNHDIGERDFTLYAINTNFESSQKSDTL